MVEDITCPPARGYEFYLLAFKSISYPFALAALTREDIDLNTRTLKLVSRNGHVIFCPFNSYFERALVLLDDNVVK